MLSVNTSLQIKALTCHWPCAVRVIQPVWQEILSKPSAKLLTLKTATPQAGHVMAASAQLPGVTVTLPGPGCHRGRLPQPCSLLGIPTRSLGAGAALEGDNSAP